MTQENKPAAGKKMFIQRRRVWGGVLILAVFAMATGAHYYFFWKNRVSTDDAFIEAHVIPISPKVPAHAIKVLVEDNQEVKEGDLLVEQDPRDYQTRLSIAKAEFEAAQAEQAQALEDVERYKKLQASDELSKQQLDRALLRLRTSEAQVSKTQANMEQAQLQLSYTKIESPSKGRVTHKNVEAGAYLQTGQALMAIVPPQRWIIANFKETQLTHIQPGQEARIKVDAYPLKIFKGHVDSIQRGTGARFSLLPAENATGNFIKVVQRIPVKIVFDKEADLSHPLAPGISAEVTVMTP